MSAAARDIKQLRQTTESEKRRAKKGRILLNCAASRRTVVLPRRDILRLNKDGRSATFAETPEKLFFFFTKVCFDSPGMGEKKKKTDNEVCEERKGTGRENGVRD